MVRCGVDFHRCYYFTRETATCIIEMNTCKSYNCYNNVTTVIHVVMVMAELVNGYNRSGKYFIIVAMAVTMVIAIYFYGD